jgi:FAD/FMN-containing dehydrogenase/Fe-S oxidoreductase
MPATETITDFLAELERRVVGDLRTDRYNRLLYSTDASIYQVMPYGVLLPKSSEDVQAAVELAAKYRVPILPRGGGSSLAGQGVNEALVIDMSRHLNRLIEVNSEEQWVRAQAGLVLDELNLHLKRLGLQFGPDPASSNRAVMGGIVANNTTGSHSIIYGMAADHILETKVILSDGSLATFGPLEAEQLAQAQQRSGLEGEIYRRIDQLSRSGADTIRAGTPRHWRRCGGYNLDRFVAGGLSYQWPKDPRFNLAKLICGSEGTLATITEVKLNLVPLPKMTAQAVIHFADIYTCLAATQVILQVQPSAIELLDELAMNLCRTQPKFARMLETFTAGRPNCILLTEFYGESEAELKAKIQQLQAHLKREKVGATGLLPVFDPEIKANIWAVRKAGLGLLMSMRGDYKPIPFIEDSAVPVEHLADYVTRIQSFCQDLGSQVAVYAHASGGCIHIRPLINTKVASELAKLPQISSFAVELLGEYGGAWSSEHGDGRARSWLNEKFYGQALYRLYQEVKQIFDPHNICNPGNIVNSPAEAQTTNLRFGPDYEVIPLVEHLDFSSDQGFHRAVEMCNGAGVCRKITNGVMCPSFMVTREEEHSTRGRANALRAALSGKLPAEELTSARMAEVMDLCISCKACKTECPSSVDMAKIKFEWLDHYHERHGIPLRSRIFGDINTLSRLNSGFPAPLVNRLLDNGLVRRAMARFLGISRERGLPTFAAEPFTRWFKRHQLTRPAAGEVLGTVALFNDTFHTYNYPQVAIAATEVLEAAGFKVVLPGHRCCGRPMMSKGLVKQARRAARDTIDRLAPLAEQGIPIVGLEPSCLLSMRDEYDYLLPGDGRVGLVAEHCFTFEEFIAQLADEQRLALTFKQEAGQVLLHGHCHQKALVGTGPSKRVLALPGYSVSEVDSSCCGMAGSFGYEAEHYQVSLQMGERRLFPAVRQQPEAVIIAAAGVSCRQQINHGTGRQPLHPAEVLRQALAQAG